MSRQIGRENWAVLAQPGTRGCRPALDLIRVTAGMGANGRALGLAHARTHTHTHPPCARCAHCCCRVLPRGIFGDMPFSGQGLTLFLESSFAKRGRQGGGGFTPSVAPHLVCALRFSARSVACAAVSRFSPKSANGIALCQARPLRHLSRF